MTFCSSRASAYCSSQWGTADADTNHCIENHVFGHSWSVAVWESWRYLWTLFQMIDQMWSLHRCIDSYVYSHCCSLRVMRIPFNTMVFQMINQMWSLNYCIDSCVHSHCCNLRVMKIPFDTMVFQMIDQMWPYIGEYVRKLLQETIEPQIRASLPPSMGSFKFSKIELGDIVCTDYCTWSLPVTVLGSSFPPSVGWFKFSKIELVDIVCTVHLWLMSGPVRL